MRGSVEEVVKLKAEQAAEDALKLPGNNAAMVLLQVSLLRPGCPGPGCAAFLRVSVCGQACWPKQADLSRLQSFVSL